MPPQLRAGTVGYTPAIRKVYLKSWERDAAFYRRAAEGSPAVAEAKMVMYTIGHEFENSPGSYGMSHGPTSDLSQMLAVVLADVSERSYIFRFFPDGTEDKIYEWVDRQWRML